MKIVKMLKELHKMCIENKLNVCNFQINVVIYITEFPI